jgi:hypothetical protein
MRADRREKRSFDRKKNRQNTIPTLKQGKKRGAKMIKGILENEQVGNMTQEIKKNHITMQHPQPFSFFLDSSAVTTGGFQLGL